MNVYEALAHFPLSPNNVAQLLTSQIIDGLRKANFTAQSGRQEYALVRALLHSYVATYYPGKIQPT